MDAHVDEDADADVNFNADNVMKTTNVIPDDTIKDATVAEAEAEEVVEVDNGHNNSVWKKVKRGFKFLLCQ